MTLPGSPPKAGWYLNASGRQQWWDGSAWGPLADGQILSGQPIQRPIRPTAAAPTKTRAAAYWLAILLGGVGAHRFYLRKFGTAWTMLVASLVQVLYRIDAHPTSTLIANVILGAMWVWIIVDLFRIPSMVDSTNRQLPTIAPRY